MSNSCTQLVSGLAGTAITLFTIGLRASVCGGYECEANGDRSVVGGGTSVIIAFGLTDDFRAGSCYYCNF